MPDVHSGKGCTIGTTMTISDKISPSMVGVDIGCGMETVKLKEREVDFQALDELIRRHIPCGPEIRRKAHPMNSEIDLHQLRCNDQVNLERGRKSIGTLGGGNHFIEVDESDDGELYLVIHSGSRHIGYEVADHYQQQAVKDLDGGPNPQIAETIARLKAEGRFKEIQAAVTTLKNSSKKLSEADKNLAYLKGEMFDDYLHDMKIIQQFAVLNRQAMIEIILNGLNLTEIDRFTTIHNYIDTDTMILRKGSVSAKAGEKLLIPINMKDGSLICLGKGNPQWNQSAPHGAGRLMSRTQAFKLLSMDQYVDEMKSVFTTSVNRLTLDESPMAYKSLDEIVAQIGPTAEIIERLRPVYNFKSNK
jgi:RNA-splicing ligase RtcB